MNKVDTKGLIIKPGGQTFFCIILVDPSGEKALVSAPTDCRERYPEDVSEESISEARHLHTTALFIPAAKKAILAAKKHGLTVSLDVDDGSANNDVEINSLLPNVDLLFLNKRGAFQLGQTDLLESAVQKLVNQDVKIVCATSGKNGSFIATCNNTFKTEAFDVKVVDTTGAGDCFAAGFIHGFLANWPLEFVAKFASAVSALSIMKFGGHAGAPTLKEVNSFLAE